MSGFPYDRDTPTEALVELVARLMWLANRGHERYSLKQAEEEWDGGNRRLLPGERDNYRERARTAIEDARRLGGRED